jgi:two-component system LytT family response regulator
VEEKNVVYLQAEGNCTMLFFKDGTKYLDTRTLKIYESILDDNNFFRVHKSYIVNIDFIQDYIHSEGHYVILKNKIEIPVARNRVQDFVKTLKGA